MEENLKKYKNELFYYALRLTGNKTDAEDLLHDTFLKALIHKDKFTGDDARAWLYAIMRNHHYNTHRKNKRFSDLFAYLDNYVLLERAGDSMPDERINEMFIIDLIDGLEASFKDPLKLYLHGYKSAEIAGRMNLNVNTVRSRIFYARTKLSRELKRWA